MWMIYIIIAILLLAVELIYFKFADKCNIIDKPNERSSHSTIVLRGGGIIFAISMVIWLILQMVNGEWCTVQDYLPFMIGLLMVSGISFVDDIHSLPDSLRMVVQIGSILLMFWSIGLLSAFDSWIWTAVVILVALFFCVGATNIINFMDGINGITAGYALAMLVPLMLLNSGSCVPLVASEQSSSASVQGFIEPSYLIVGCGFDWHRVYHSVCIG